MAKFITQAEMLPYAGKDKAAFPAGTILTPLAKDYAAENHIRIIIGDSCPNREEDGEAAGCITEREKILREIVLSVKKNVSGSGRHVSKEEMEKIVIDCIQRIGCSVIM